jgi:hypothetical protein
MNGINLFRDSFISELIQMKKLLFLLTILASCPMMAISFVGFSGQARADGLYNAREELEYSPQARMARQEERNQQIQLLRYQQQEYMQHQRLMERETFNNQVYRSGARLNSRVFLGESDRQVIGQHN